MNIVLVQKLSYRFQLGLPVPVTRDLIQRATIIFEYLISLLELTLMSGYGPLHSLGLAEG